MRWLKVLPLLLLATAQFGCRSAGPPPFRGNRCFDYSQQQPPPVGDKHCFFDVEQRQDECAIEKKDREGGYRLAHIEFTENGSYAAPCQLDWAINLIDEVNPPRGRVGRDDTKPGAIVVTFVHGWRNDASPDNVKSKGNLFYFTNLLSGLANAEKKSAAETGRAAREIVGIYVAWRGEAFRAPRWLGFLEYPTFWARSETATHIASSPVATQALVTLLKTVQRNPRSRSIVVGHSMGALLLERAVSQSLIGSVIDAVYEAESTAGRPLCKDGEEPLCTDTHAPPLCQDGTAPICLDDNAPRCKGGNTLCCDDGNAAACRDGSTPGCGNGKPPLCADGTEPRLNTFKPLADLIVLVNSAAPAQQTEHLRQTLEMGVDLTSGQGFVQGPLILSVTAKNDDPTKRAFPLGMWFANQGRSLPPKDGHLSPRRLASHTAGHLQELHTHEILKYQESSDPCEGVSFPDNVLLCDENGDPSGPRPKSVTFMVGSRKYTMTRKGDETLAPYWIMQVPKEVIDGHSKIFVPSFEDFLRGLIIVTGASSPSPEAEKSMVVSPEATRQSPPQEP